MAHAAYPTATDFKTWAKISGDGDDTLIGWLVDAAVAFVERHCGRSFLDQTEQTVKVNPAYPNLLGRSNRTLLVAGGEFVVVTSIENGDGETLDSGDYTLLPLAGPPYYMVEIDADAGKRWWRGPTGAGVVRITGTTGFAANVPDDVWLAALQIVEHYYRARSSGGRGHVATATRQGLIIEPGDVPADVLRVLSNYRG